MKCLAPAGRRAAPAYAALAAIAPLTAWEVVWCATGSLCLMRDQIIRLQAQIRAPERTVITLGTQLMAAGLSPPPTPRPRAPTGAYRETGNG